MNTLTVILIMLAIIVTMGGTIYILLKDKKAKKKETEKLQDKLTSANENLFAMKHYIEQILAIKADTQSTIEKIKEAKTDEEVLNILADIISANNNRVQND
jgi:preprotein translocase subunit YajC